MIKLTEILNEILEEKEDRCLRIARRKYDKPSAYRSGAIVRCRRSEIWKDVKSETVSTNENLHTIKCVNCGWKWSLEDGGKDPYTCHKCGFDNSKVYNLDEKQKESLHKWFSRQGGPGKSKGWVDCNTCREVDGKKKCQPCGRQKGETRAKYPSCRPTPSQCSRPGKGKTWGKTK